MATTQPLALNQNVKTRTYVAEGAITRGVGCVEGTAEGQTKIAAGADAGSPTGVALNDAANGEQVEIAYEGIVAAQAGATCTRGAPVSIHGSDGQFKDAAPGTGANTTIFGFARTTQTVADGWFSLQISLSVMQGA